jgi:hypothetical protein
MTAMAVGEAHRSAAEEADPDRDRFGDAVQQGAEHNRHAVASGLLAAGALAVPGSMVVEDPVAAVEGECSGTESDHHGAGSPTLERLSGQLEGEGADEYARAEGHDECPCADGRRAGQRPAPSSP